MSPLLKKVLTLGIFFLFSTFLLAGSTPSQGGGTAAIGDIFKSIFVPKSITLESSNSQCFVEVDIKEKKVGESLSFEVLSSKNNCRDLSGLIYRHEYTERLPLQLRIENGSGKVLGRYSYTTSRYVIIDNFNEPEEGEEHIGGVELDEGIIHAIFPVNSRAERVVMNDGQRDHVLTIPENVLQGVNIGLRLASGTSLDNWYVGEYFLLAWTNEAQKQGGTYSIALLKEGRLVDYLAVRFAGTRYEGKLTIPGLVPGNGYAVRIESDSAPYASVQSRPFEIKDPLLALEIQDLTVEPLTMNNAVDATVNVRVRNNASIPFNSVQLQVTDSVASGRVPATGNYIVRPIGGGLHTFDSRETTTVSIPVHFTSSNGAASSTARAGESRTFYVWSTGAPLGSTTVNWIEANALFRKNISFRLADDVSERGATHIEAIGGTSGGAVPTGGVMYVAGSGFVPSNAANNSTNKVIFKNAGNNRNVAEAVVRGVDESGRNIALNVPEVPEGTYYVQVENQVTGAVSNRSAEFRIIPGVVVPPPPAEIVIKGSESQTPVIVIPPTTPTEVVTVTGGEEVRVGIRRWIGDSFILGVSGQNSPTRFSSAETISVPSTSSGQSRITLFLPCTVANRRFTYELRVPTANNITVPANQNILVTRILFNAICGGVREVPSPSPSAVVPAPSASVTPTASPTASPSPSVSILPSPSTPASTAPRIDSVSPTRVTAGTDSITINGSGFAQASDGSRGDTVMFTNTTGATYYVYQVFATNNRTVMSFVPPATIPTGTYTISIRSGSTQLVSNQSSSVSVIGAPVPTPASQTGGGGGTSPSQSPTSSPSPSSSPSAFETSGSFSLANILKGFEGWIKEIFMGL